MFVDEASITVAGGDGGAGCSSFRREKFVPRGGPDGGSGGNGGSVLLVADEGRSTLLQFRHHIRFKAVDGRAGQGSNKTGRSGKDLEILVPVGTVVLDDEGVRRLADLSRPGQRFVAARGGCGGRGNASYASSTRRTPTRHEPGEPGEERRLRLELKLLADVGLLGFPNAGKSTLLSRISAATPKVADYPFTTLEPNLGVVDRGDFRSFVAADIPGLIEGAHRGAGLGHRFLRHVERCRLLLHLVDPTDTDREPVRGLESLDEELRQFRPELAAKPQIVVLTKADAVQDPGPADAVRAHAQETGREVHVISAVTGAGLDELIRTVSQHLDRIEAPESGPAAVGVLGGTFDPVHLGHLAAASAARRMLGLDRMLLLPAARPPHKVVQELAPARDREAMLRLAVAEHEELEVSPVELEREEVGYTIDSLRLLRDGDTPCRPVFVLGMDALLEIDTWRDWRTLIAEFDLAVIDRPGRTLAEVRPRLLADVGRRLVEPGNEELEELGNGGRVFHLPMKPIPVSSSEVRARAAQGRSLDGLVPPAVARYILEEGLYRTIEKEDGR